MLAQVELFDLLEYEPAVVQPVRRLLEERCKEWPRPQTAFGKVVICSGHMIDKDRETPRFPPEKETAVQAEIAKQLAAWGIGAGDLAVCGGARGADILFAEECARRGARVRLLLAEDLDTFLAHSVRLEGSRWVERFHDLRALAHVEIATQPERLGEPPVGVSVFERNNAWIINTARVEATDSAQSYALLVWDEGASQSGLGGAADFAARLSGWGGPIAVINPTKLSL